MNDLHEPLAARRLRRERDALVALQWRCREQLDDALHWQRLPRFREQAAEDAQRAFAQMCAHEQAVSELEASYRKIVGRGMPPCPVHQP